MTFTIDTAYDKHIAHVAGYGYDMRASPHPSSIVVHSTNGKKGSSFADEAEYLRDSPKVSAHYLIGKDGRISQILPPLGYRAWHAGAAIPAFLNEHSIGIENHHAVGDDWPQAQLDALTYLTRLLMRTYTIATALVETHRHVALPKGRKSDPNDWPDPAFYAWRDGLAGRRYRVKGLPIYHASNGQGAVAGYLTPDQEVVIDQMYPEGTGHLGPGGAQAGLGFVDMDGLELV